MKNKIMFYSGVVVFYVGFVMGSTKNWFDIIQFGVMLIGLLLIADQFIKD